MRSPKPQPAGAFVKIVDALEGRLEDLLASSTYGRGAGRTPPPMRCSSVTATVLRYCVSG
jgi:hypothetical protein